MRKFGYCKGFELYEKQRYVFSDVKFLLRTAEKCINCKNMQNFQLSEYRYR